MKRAIVSILLALSLAITVLCAPVGTAYAAGEIITVNPTSGFDFITIKGTGFGDYYYGTYGGPQILFTWDGNFIPTWPAEVYVEYDYLSANYTVTAYITAATVVPGNYTIQAWAMGGGDVPSNSPVPIEGATTAFTVLDARGPAGAQGEPGEGGPLGPPGSAGAAGEPGSEGAQGGTGTPGISIQSAVGNGDGTFTLSFTDGSSYTTDDLTGRKGGPGPAGETGPAGEPGPVGESGPAGALSMAAIILAVLALGWMVIGVLRKVLLR